MKIWKMCGVALAITAPATQSSAERLFGLTGSNTIVTFDSTAPATVTSAGAIAGVAAGETLTGIDLRPADRQLYSVATSGSLYRITKNATGSGYTATLIGDLATAAGTQVNISGARFGIDFNPTVDRLRFVSDFDQNLRINPNNAVTIVDGTITAPGAEAFVGAAYTNNFAGATTTQLYTLDASGNQLALAVSPNDGTYNNVGVVSGVDFGALNNVGFDISGATGDAFFSNGSSLFSINLNTAAATSLGTIGAGSLVGLTAGGVPEPSSWALMIIGFGAVGGMMRTRKTLRTATLAA